MFELLAVLSWWLYSADHCLPERILVA